MFWDGMGWDGMGWNGMIEMDGMGLAGKRWDWMGWGETGWHGASKGWENRMRRKGNGQFCQLGLFHCLMHTTVVYVNAVSDAVCNVCCC